MNAPEHCGCLEHVILVTDTSKCKYPALKADYDTLRKDALALMLEKDELLARIKELEATDLP